MLNFPNAPSNGQTYSNYQFDGQKWQSYPSQAINSGDLVSSTNPLMNGAVLPGLSYTYTRADHRHPSDTSRAVANNQTLTGSPTGVNATITGTLTVTGKITATADGHTLGTAGGNVGAPTLADANIQLYVYDGPGGNWAGIGASNSGYWWFRTGLSGTPAAAMYIDTSYVAHFTNTPYAPTPATADNSAKAATTAFVMANPASGPYLLLSGGTHDRASCTSMVIYRSVAAITQAWCFLGNTGAQVHLQQPCGLSSGRRTRQQRGRDGCGATATFRYAYHQYQAGLCRRSEHRHLRERLTRIYAGGVITASDGDYNQGSLTRYRQFQMQRQRRMVRGGLCLISRRLQR